MSSELEVVSGLWTALIVEDEPIIAHDLEMRLIRLGAAQVGVACTAAEASALLETFTPTVAVVDWHLGRSTAAELIEELTAASIEIVVLTGVNRAILELPAGADVPVLSKPSADRVLTPVVAGAVLRGLERVSRGPSAAPWTSDNTKASLAITGSERTNG